MYSNGYSVRIPQGKEENQYVSLRHGTEYTLNIKNTTGMRCDAYVSIDGQEVGAWRVNPQKQITLERPAKVDRKFTFYKLGSEEGDRANLSGNKDLGLVSVTFKPEVARQPEAVTRGISGSRGGGLLWDSPIGATCGMKGLSAGGTGLGAHSAQTFGSTNELEYDVSNEFTIHLRLRAEDDIVPLSVAASTPVPPSLV